MKNLLILRHAKSDWSQPYTSDYDRPLNERGKKDAPLIGEEIFRRKIVPQIILSSTAKRAKRTAEKVSQSFNYQGKIVWMEKFYFGDEDDIIKALQTIESQYERVMIVGHNPTLENLVALLTSSKMDIELPTASLVSIDFNFEAWNKLTLNSGEFKFIIKPRDIEANNNKILP